MQLIKKLLKKIPIILESKILKISDIPNLATTAALNTKLNQAKNEILSITNLLDYVYCSNCC